MHCNQCITDPPLFHRELWVLLAGLDYLVSRDRLAPQGIQDLLGYLELRVVLVWMVTREMMVFGEKL